MNKIIIINHYGITPDTPGATKHYDMAKYFSNKNTHSVEFWMCGYNHHTGKNYPMLQGLKLQASEEEKNLKIVRVKGSPYRKSSILRQLNITLFDLITSFKILFSGKVDVVVLSVPPISIFTVLIIKLKRIKLVVDVEDLWPLFLIEMGMTNKMAIKYMDVFSNYLYRSSSGISAVSEGMKRYAQERAGNHKKEIWLAPLGVNLKEYTGKSKNNDLIADKAWKDAFKIMYIGAHGRANDLQSVLETIKEFNWLEDTKYEKQKKAFIFIGDGDQKKALLSYRDTLGLDNVFFEEAIPGKQVPDFLEHADVCLTNLKKVESFKLVRPNKIFQYMAMKKPVVSGIWGESREIIESAEAGVYIDFTNYKNAAKTLYEMIHNEERLKEYALNGIEYVKQFGDRERIFEDYYNRLIQITTNQGE